MTEGTKWAAGIKRKVSLVGQLAAASRRNSLVVTDSVDSSTCSPFGGGSPLSLSNRRKSWSGPAPSSLLAGFELPLALHDHTEEDVEEHHSATSDSSVLDRQISSEKVTQDDTCVAGGVLVDFLQRTKCQREAQELAKAKECTPPPPSPPLGISRQKTKSSLSPNSCERKTSEHPLSPKSVRSDSMAFVSAIQKQVDVAVQLLEPHEEVLRVWSGYSDAAAQINAELLVAGIMDDATKFWKVNKNPDWKVDTKTLLRKHATDISKALAQAKCLNQEVSACIFRNKIVECRPPDIETPEVRHGRTQQIWSQMHEGSRKVEVPAIKAPFKDDLRKRLFGEEDPEDGGMCPKSAARIARCVTNVQQRPMSAGGVLCEMRKESSLMRDLDWKHRSCRSKASAGTWDWAHGSPSLSRPATAGREAHNKHWSASLFHVDDDELRGYVDDAGEVLKEGGVTFLSASIKSIAHPRNVMEECHNHMLKRSSSLPNLKKLSTTTALHNHVPTVRQVSSSKKGAQRTSARSQSRQLHEVGASRDRSQPGLSRDNCRSQPRQSRSIGTFAHLPASSAYTVPWQNRSPEPVLRCEDTAVKRYLRACLQNNTVPRPMPFITGHSLKLNAGGQVLSDTDLLDITVALDQVSLEDINLEDNTSLTEKSLLKFVHVLSESPTCASLLRLSLKRCLHASKHSVSTCIIRLLGNPKGIENLQHLDLTHVKMGIRCHLPFAKAVRQHARLNSLILCDTGLGLKGNPSQGPEVKEFIYNLLGSRSVQVLDLGWNCLTQEFFAHLGERHIQMQRLHRLTLSNCTTAPPNKNESTSIGHFLQHLARDRTLRFLDISLNHIDFRSALVLEDALMHCKKLSEINIAHNPLGVLGMRSLMRLLCRDSCGLIFFNCDDCFSGAMGDKRDGLQLFNESNPGGRYTLELDRPYHRAMLRMLYKLCDRFGLQLGEAFSQPVYSFPPWVHAQKDDNGIWIVPGRGVLSVTFCMDLAIHKLMEGCHMYDFDTYLRRYFSLMKLAPSFRKLVPLFAQWHSVKFKTAEQLVMLDALSKDFLFTYPHVKQMARSDLATSEILVRLLGCVDGGTAMRYMSLKLNKKLTGFLHSLKENSSLMLFNVHNPNGHYKLHLGQHSEHAVAERLLLLDRWESNLAIKQGRVDISQRGNQSVIRNEMFQHHPIDARAMVEWHLPEYDILELDYSSNRRLSADAVALDDITHSNIMVALQQFQQSQESQETTKQTSTKMQTAALRMSSHAICLTSKQLRALFGLYSDEESYVELVVIFLTRITDIYNEKVFRVRIEKDALLERMRGYIGAVSMFPFIQPEQSCFELRLNDREHRTAANLLVVLSKYEDPWNLREPDLRDAEGRRVVLPSGVPRAWEKLDAIPKEGTLSLTYVCAPEHRNVGRRKQLAETYGHWHMPAALKDSDVLWWASMRDVSPDVVGFLEYLLTRFDTMRDAFVHIDGGEGGNGHLSLREFEEGYFRMGCKKFSCGSKAEEMARIAVVFRWLDPSGEGTVSLREFMILDQMYSEVMLSIEEFVEFCMRTFGEMLEDAYTFLDDDGSGEIDEGEWQEACRKIGYLGPVKSIFKFCDKDEEGTISIDEFMALDRFKKLDQSRPASKPA